MPTTSADLQSKINRAIRAALLDQGAGSVVDTFAAPTSDNRTLPNTTIVCGDGQSFDGPGNFQFPEVSVILRDDAAVQPEMQDSNQPRVAANGRASDIFNALNRSDDATTLYFTAKELTRLGNLLAVDQSSGADPVQAKIAADNADMADFTILWLECTGMSSPVKMESGATYWERVISFSCVACNANLTAN